MNDINEMIKQAYAYGASIALQEAGYAPAQAEATAAQMTLEKTAEEGLGPLETALLGGGTGALLGAGGGALYGHLAKKNLINQLLGAGASAQRAGGKGIDKLRGLLSKGEGAAAAAGKGPTMAGGMAPGEMTAAIERGAQAPKAPFGGRGSRSGMMAAEKAQPSALEEAIAASEAGPGRLEQLRQWLAGVPRKAVMPGGIASPVGSPMLGSTAGGAGLGALLGAGGGGLYGALD